MMINRMPVSAFIALSMMSENVKSDVNISSNATEWCRWITNRTCPDPEVNSSCTPSNRDEPQLVYIDDSPQSSNLSTSFFNPQKPSKIIIHGFRSDMLLTPLIEMKTGKRRRRNNANNDNLMSLIIRVSTTWRLQCFLRRLVQLVNDIEFMLPSRRSQHSTCWQLHGTACESYQRCWRCEYSCHWIFAWRSSNKLRRQRSKA